MLLGSFCGMFWYFFVYYKSLNFSEAGSCGLHVSWAAFELLEMLGLLVPSRCRNSQDLIGKMGLTWIDMVTDVTMSHYKIRIEIMLGPQ